MTLDADTPLALLGLAFLLGARHGFDADHLALIDGVSRINAEKRPLLARWAGALFSLGHGSVVVAGVIVASMLAEARAIPAWLETSGTIVSVAFLVVLAVLNLKAAVFTPSDTIVRPTGFRARWLANAPFLTTAWGVALTGMLFAASFDTISQAVLFAVVGEQMGTGVATLAAITFVAGMVVVDGLNGLWFARVMRSASRTALIASRLLAGAVGVISLSIAALAASSAFSPAAGAWAEANGLWVSFSVMAAVVAVALVGMAVGRASADRAPL